MSSFVRFTKDALVSFEWNTSQSQYIPTKKATSHIQHLRRPCEIDSDVTLRDIFRIIKLDRNLVEFLRDYSSCEKIDEYHTEIEFCSSNPSFNLLEIRLEPHIDIFRRSSQFSFDGVAFHFNVLDVENVPMFLPLNEIIDLPVKISTQCNLRFDGEELHTLNFSRFTLLEVLDSIYLGISFLDTINEWEKERIQEVLKNK